MFCRIDTMSLGIINNIIMPRTVTTTTISLPKTMASRLKALSRHENRTTSELMREALRMYERATASHKMDRTTWQKLSHSLKRISRVGKQIDLSDFISRDRKSH